MGQCINRTLNDLKNVHSFFVVNNRSQVKIEMHYKTVELYKYRKNTE